MEKLDYTMTEVVTQLAVTKERMNVIEEKQKKQDKQCRWMVVAILIAMFVVGFIESM